MSPSRADTETALRDAVYSTQSRSRYLPRPYISDSSATSSTRDGLDERVQSYTEWARNVRANQQARESLRRRRTTSASSDDIGPSAAPEPPSNRIAAHPAGAVGLDALTGVHLVRDDSGIIRSVALVGGSPSVSQEPPAVSRSVPQRSPIRRTPNASYEYERRPDDLSDVVQQTVRRNLLRESHMDIDDDAGNVRQDEAVIVHSSSESDEEFSDDQEEEHDELYSEYYEDLRVRRNRRHEESWMNEEKTERSMVESKDEIGDHKCGSPVSKTNAVCGYKLMAVCPISGEKFDFGSLRAVFLA